VTRSRRVEPDNSRPDVQLGGQPMDLVCEVESVPLGTLLQRPDRRVRLSTRSFRGKRVGVLEIDLLETLSLFRSQSRRGNSEGFHRTLERLLFDGTAHKRWLYHPRQGALIRHASEELKARTEREEGEFRQQRVTEQQLREQRRRQLGNQRRQEARVAHPPRAPVQARLERSEGKVEDALGERFGPGAQNGSTDKPSVVRGPKPKRVRSEPVRYECVLCQHTWTGTRLGLNPSPKCESHLYRRALPRDESG